MRAYMRLDRSASMRRSATTRRVYQTIDASKSAMSAAKISSGLPRRMRSADPVRPQVGLQRFGDGHGTVRVLVVLQEAGDHPRERETRAVQRMHKARLLALGGAEANVRAPRLKVREVAARRHLEPSARAGRPRFEIVRLRGREARVTRGEQLAPVREP